MRKCPHCGYSIYDNEIVFCPSCKGLIDKKLNLINDIDKLLYQYDKHENKTQNINTEEIRQQISQETSQEISQNNTTIREIKKRKEKSNTIYIIFILTIIIITIFVIMK